MCTPQKSIIYYTSRVACLRRATAPDALSNHVTATAQNIMVTGLNSNVGRQRIKFGKSRKSSGTIIRKWPSSAKEKAEMHG